MERPPSVTMLGKTHVIFGVLSIAWGLWGLVSAAGLTILGSMTDATDASLSAESVATMKAIFGRAPAVFTGAAGLVRLLAGAGLIAAGIGLLKLKPWARTWSIAYVVYAAIMAAAVAVSDHLFIVRPMLAIATDQLSAQATSPDATGAMLLGAVLGSAFLTCPKLIYPAIVFILMSAPDVKNALHPDAARDGAPPPPPLQEG